MKTALYIIGGLAVACVAFLALAAVKMFEEKEKALNTARTQAARDARWAKPRTEEKEVENLNNTESESN